MVHTTSTTDPAVAAPAQLCLLNCIYVAQRQGTTTDNTLLAPHTVDRTIDPGGHPSATISHRQIVDPNRWGGFTQISEQGKSF